MIAADSSFTSLASPTCQFLLVCRSGRDIYWAIPGIAWCQVPGLSWVLATPDGCHGGMAIALWTSQADRYRDPAGQYGGITITMLIIMFLRIITVLFSLNFTVAARSNMRPSQPCERLLCLRLAWFLGPVLFAVLSGCGPAASDDASNQGSRASLGTPSESQHAPAANPVTIAAPSASSYASTPVAKEEPAPLPENLVLPTWMAQALNAPEVSVRLRALDTWALQGAQAPMDPLIVALDDDDDDVRSKAMAIIERNWAIEQEAEAQK